MQQLTHLEIVGHNLLAPSNAAKLPNLVTLYVNPHSCTKAVFSSLPNLEKLVIKIELQPDADAATTFHCFEHPELLSKLESLKCVVVNPWMGCHIIAPPHRLPSLPRWLKKLSLSGLGYSWEHMTSIGSLPQLQVLKLRCSAFRGVKLELSARDFRSLEHLLLDDHDLVQWTAAADDDDDCLPRLRSLVIRHCYKLKEIPGHIDPFIYGLRAENTENAEANTYSSSCDRFVLDG